MKRNVIVAGSALALVLGATSFSLADKVSDALRKAPPAVQATVIELAGANKISEFDSEMSAGKPIFDLEYKIDGATYAADIDPSGKILTREVSCDVSILPPVVVQAAEKAHTGVAIDEPAIVNADGKMFYEMEMKVGADTHEVQIDPMGKVLSDTIEPAEAPAAAGAEKPAAKPAAKPAQAEEKD